MNREHPVLVFDYDASQKTFSSAIEVIDSNRAPLALVSPRGLKPNSSAIKYWWAHRAIPQTRFGVEEKLQELGLDKHYQLPFASFGLSLSDQYWVKPENLDGLNWKDINYFNNGFESIASNIASEKGAAKKDAAYKTAAKRGASKDSKDKQSADKDSENIKSASRDSENRKSAKESDMSSNWLAEVGLNSPDNTSEGELKKTWICKGKKRILLKGSSALGQEPYNELLATRLFKRLLNNDEYVDYFLDDCFGETVSACECFLHDDEEYIPAYYVLNVMKKPNHYNNFVHLIDCFEALGVRHSDLFLSKMIVCDDILGNFDRHFRNFGVIRNVETLECKMAPLFDSGSSLWCNKTLSELEAKNYTFNTKPFYEDANRQLRLVDDYSWFDISLVRDFPEEVGDVLSKCKELKLRSSCIADAVSSRIKRIEAIL